MKIQLYSGAIVFACDAVIQEILQDQVKALELIREASKTYTTGRWLWKKTIARTDDEIAALCANYQSRWRSQKLDRLECLRGIAKHHKPAAFISVEDEYLLDIGKYLAPSEPFVVEQGEKYRYSERI
jgi:hypothetical protein